MTRKHGNTKVSDTDILFIEEQFKELDAEILTIKNKKSRMLAYFSITEGHYKKRLKDIYS